MSEYFNDYAVNIRSAHSAPWAQVIIFADYASGGSKIMDVSQDAASMQITENLNDCSTWTLSLRNRECKYIGAFTPFDRIIVLGGRNPKESCQILTGYVREVPMEGMYDNEIIRFSGTCTLGKLQKIWWDPKLSKWLYLASLTPDALLRELMTNVELGGFTADNVFVADMSQALKDRWNSLPNKTTAAGDINQSSLGKITDGASGYSGGVSSNIPDTLTWKDSKGVSQTTNGVRGIIEEAAQKYGIPPGLLAARIEKESGWNPMARNTGKIGDKKANQFGLMQLGAATNELGQQNPGMSNGTLAKEVCADGRWRDPYWNIMAGAEEYKNWIDKANGDYRMGTAYNHWGPNIKDYVYADACIQLWKSKYDSDFVNTATPSAYNAAGISNAASADVGKAAQVSHNIPIGAGYLSEDKEQMGTITSGGYTPINGMWAPTGTISGFSDSYGAPRDYRATASNPHPTHQGIDLMGPTGTPIYAVVSGTVKVNPDNGGSAGNNIRLYGDDGNVYKFMHLQGFNVTDGVQVKGGQQIGTMDSTGSIAMAPHLHFEIHLGGNGNPINPYKTLTQLYINNQQPKTGPQTTGLSGTYTDLSANYLDNPFWQGQGTGDDPWDADKDKKWVDDVPLLSYIGKAAGFGMYHFCTNGAGQFVALIPNHSESSIDYVLRSVDITSFNKKAINDSDYYTHIYVFGDLDFDGIAQDFLWDWFAHGGPASTVFDPINSDLVKYDVIMSKAGFSSPGMLVSKIGIRPKVIYEPMLFTPTQCQMYADFMFREYWMSKYAATANCTFQPQIRPMTRVTFAERSWNYYVERVVHTLFSEWTTQLVCTSGRGVGY